MVRARLEQQKEALRQKYHRAPTEHEVIEDQKLSKSLQVSSDFEYARSSGFWGVLFKADRALSQYTGIAMTKNAQKLLDARVLARSEDTPLNQLPEAAAFEEAQPRVQEQENPPVPPIVEVAEDEPAAASPRA